MINKLQTIAKIGNTKSNTEDIVKNVKANTKMIHNSLRNSRKQIN